MRFALTFWLFSGLSLAWAGEKLQVASLSTVLTDVARNVGGDHVQVTAIVKPGIDPHDFQPTPGDIKTLSASRLVLASGLGFEGYLEKIRSAVGSGPVFLVVGESIKPLMAESGHNHDHSHGPGNAVPDPHWWHSISNVQIATQGIREALIALDPANTVAYKTNAAAYSERLDELARWTRVQVAGLPRDRRILVTSHDALGYFAKDYGFEIRPVEGISTGEQPSSKRVRELIDAIRKDGVKAIFAENVENPKVLEEITRETGARNGGTLYSDGLGDTEANTYESMMRHNITTIVSALK